MFIVIIGGGKIGYYLVQSLVREGHEVTVIEKNRVKAQHISDDFDAVSIAGDGCDPRVLEEAGVGRADVLVAGTGDDEDNLVICQVAKLRFHVPYAIGRVNNPKNEIVFQKLGIDSTINSTGLVLKEIQSLLVGKS